MQRLGLGAKQEAGGDMVLLREPEGVAVVVGGEDPRGSRGGRGDVRQKPQRTAGGELRGCVRCDDENALVREGKGEVGDRSFECLVRQGGEADHEVAGVRLGGGGGDVSLRGCHRARDLPDLTFSLSD